MKYVVTGGTGFLGRHLVSRLEAAGHTVAVPRSASCDLLQLGQVLDFLARERPDRIIHSAAYYGGLGINVVEPATIYFRNVTMGANLFEAARQVDSIRKIVVVGTACSYPGKLENLMREEDFWAGPVHGSVENYGITKKIMSVQGRAYKAQYGLDSIHLVLTNLYGPWDSYNPHRSHVVAALVRKFVEAKRANARRGAAVGHGHAGARVPLRRGLRRRDPRSGGGLHRPAASAEHRHRHRHVDQGAGRDDPRSHGVRRRAGVGDATSRTARR